MRRLGSVALAASIGFLGTGIALAETGALVRKLPVSDDCVSISLTGQFASKPAADTLSPAPAHFAGIRRQAMNAMAAGKRPKNSLFGEVAINAVAGSSLTVPAAVMREILLGLGASDTAVAKLPDHDYTASYLDPGVYLFEVSLDGASDFRALIAQPLLALPLPEKPLGLRIEVMMYEVDAGRSAGTGQVVYPYPVCLNAEIETGGLMVNLGELGKFRNGGLVISPGGIHLRAGTEYTPYSPPGSPADEQPESASTTGNPSAKTMELKSWSVECDQNCVIVLRSLDSSFEWRFIAGQMAGMPAGYIASNTLIAGSLFFSYQLANVASAPVVLLFGGGVHEDVAFDDMSMLAEKKSLRLAVLDMGRYTLSTKDSSGSNWWAAYFARCEPKMNMWIDLKGKPFSVPFDLSGFDAVMAFLKSNEVEVRFDNVPLPSPCFD